MHRCHIRTRIFLRRHHILARTQWAIYPVNNNPNDPKAPIRDEDGLPPPPRYLLANREECELPILRQRVPAGEGIEGDNPLYCLYRIYEHLVLDQHLGIRNELEGFWYHGTDWPVHGMPDPEDVDPERYAVVACITRLLALAFNMRISLGVPRHAPGIFTREQLEAWQAQERVYEEEPSWVKHVPRLRRRLDIPHWDNSVRAFVSLPGFDDERASDEFKDKNILLWQPHIHFL
ncbi:hypothetical protein Sste5346_004138 [Sporothrix stenoceras]|uniref:Uncharacterized protein n=1 Tax=Sporothrix stenoceras TaxID=5173 RepID=A0ABR3ZB90_9PEZI